MLHGSWDPSSLTRDGTWSPAVKSLSPNYWTAGEFPQVFFLTCRPYIFPITLSPHPLLLPPTPCLSLFFLEVCWRTLVICSLGFSIIWVLLLASLWCHLTCSSVFQEYWSWGRALLQLAEKVSFVYRHCLWRGFGKIGALRGPQGGLAVTLGMEPILTWAGRQSGRKRSLRVQMGDCLALGEAREEVERGGGGRGRVIF